MLSSDQLQGIRAPFPAEALSSSPSRRYALTLTGLSPCLGGRLGRIGRTRWR